MSAPSSQIPATTVPLPAGSASVAATAAFAVITIGATVMVVAAFLALLIGGGNGARGLFALVAGSLAYAALVLVQFIHWAAVLLRALKGRS